MGSAMENLLSTFKYGTRGRASGHGMQLDPELPTGGILSGGMSVTEFPTDCTVTLSLKVAVTPLQGRPRRQ